MGTHHGGVRVSGGDEGGDRGGGGVGGGEMTRMGGSVGGAGATVQRSNLSTLGFESVEPMEYGGLLLEPSRIVFVGRFGEPVGQTTPIYTTNLCRPNCRIR